MTIALMKQRRELNKRKLAALAFLAKQTEVDEWPERLEALAKKPEALGNEGMIRSLVQEVVQEVAVKGTLPKAQRPGRAAKNDEPPGPAKQEEADEPAGQAGE
jgi:hypothetical protein